MKAAALLESDEEGTEGGSQRRMFDDIKDFDESGWRGESGGLRQVSRGQKQERERDKERDRGEESDQEQYDRAERRSEKYRYKRGERTSPEERREQTEDYRRDTQGKQKVEEYRIDSPNQSQRFAREQEGRAISKEVYVPEYEQQQIDYDERQQDPHRPNTKEQTYRSDEDQHPPPQDTHKINQVTGNLEQTQEPEIDSEEEQENFIKEIKLVLKKLFAFYGSFGNRIGSDKMNFTQFLKLANDANLVSGKLDQKTITLIFTSVNKVQSNLRYEGFVRVLHGLAKRKFPNGDTNSKFKRLLKANILPLYETIYEETDLGTEDRVLKSRINFGTLMLIHMKLATLKGIYRRYFMGKSKAIIAIEPTKVFEASRKDLFAFLREFEILPVLINNSLASNFYGEIYNVESWVEKMGAHAQTAHDLAKITGALGTGFTFFKFVLFLVKISAYAFAYASNLPKFCRAVRFTADERFYLLLERMEVSRGFHGICLTHVDRVSHPRLVLTGGEIGDMHRETNAFPHFEDFLPLGGSERPWMLSDARRPGTGTEQDIYLGLCETGNNQFSQSGGDRKQGRKRPSRERDLR